MATPCHIMRLLCDNFGSLDLGQVKSELKKSFTVNEVQLERLLSDHSSFVVVEQSPGSGALVLAKTELRVCTTQEKCGGCEQLHLCRFLVCGKCWFGPKCKNSHDLKSTHNSVILKKKNLHELQEAQLFQLLLQNDPLLLPEICPHYNKGNGEHGSCKYETSCTNLHLCQHFLQDGCKFGADCKRAHSFDAAMKILNDRGFSRENSSKLNKIYKNKLLISSYKEKPAVLPPREKTAAPRTVGKRCSTQQSNNLVSEANRHEICLFNILQGCSFKEKCVRVHHDLPYKWEILDRNGVTWKQLPNEEHIERAYCNPANDMSSGPQAVNFITMKCEGLSVRRLSTGSSVTKPPYFILTTEWLWYWKNEQKKWTEFGRGDSAKHVSSITSKDLEDMYLKKVQTEIQFSVANDNYVLNLKDMYQQSLRYSTKREVRRRPVYVSYQDVKSKLKSSSSSSVEVPDHWNKEALPEFSHKIVPVSKSADDYKKIESLFKQTMPTKTIHNIRRVQNPSLWRVFQWQKEQMRDGSGRRDVDERYLFHGTDQSLIETISKENFDWRICGVHGTSFGKGSYFARDARYSNTYTKSKNGIKMMFAALVLVGEFVKGNSKYLRPPQRKDKQGFYDSCVDKEDNPTIFVIFEKYQIYPEYIIEYS